MGSAAGWKVGNRVVARGVGDRGILKSIREHEDVRGGEGGRGGGADTEDGGS